MTTPYWPRNLARLGLQRNSSFVRLIVLGLIDTTALVLAWAMVVAWSTHVLGTTAFIVLVSIVLCQLIAGSALSLYRNRFAIGSGLELRRQGVVAVIVTTFVIAMVLFSEWSLEVPWFLLGLLCAQVLMIAGRQGLRMWIDNERRPQGGERVVIVGAGEVGASLISQMLRAPRSGYLPVAIVDDDPAKSKVVLDGVHVKGRTADIQAVVDDHGASGVVVAIAEAPAEVFAALVQHLDLARTWVRTVPTLADLLSSDVELSGLRDMNVADLIGRQAVDPETDQIRSLVDGKTVLVTGAGGSIGSELCRLISRHSPARLIMLDRDESALHSLCMSLDGRALMDSPDLVLADIRDRESIELAFALHRPQLVIHAAALKHLPMLESYPAEGWKTNVHGTLNVLRAAQKTGVDHFVNISTDKAANPSSELGRSKFLAERMTSHFAGLTGKPYVSVRFGNVLGSRGSVLISFAEQIRRGGPLTVTHPEVTRYFMTIPEACLLVLQAASEGEPGETLVLDMGEPVRIVDIAQRMMTLAGASCPIAYTGLRDGEKLHEELFTPAEGERLTDSGTAWHLRVPGIAPDSLPDSRADLAAIREAYARHVDAGTIAAKPVEPKRAEPELVEPKRAEPRTLDAGPVVPGPVEELVARLQSPAVKESLR